jgi:hypothetical protein
MHRFTLALALVATASFPAGAEAQPSGQAWLEAALDARALTDDDFARTEVWSWTTEEQAALLAGDRRLLRSGPGDGATRGPYQRALDELLASTTADAGDVALARLLSTHPALAMRRYAWTTPYGTVLPRGGRSYGPVLIRIELDPGAWHARFAPDERPAFRIVDASGAAVTTAQVLESPSRLATVVHVRAHDPDGAFREIVVHGGVVRWSMGTPEIAARVEEDRRVLAALRRAARGGPRPSRRPMAPSWATRAAAREGISSRMAGTMAFDTPRHRMSDPSLAALEEAMARRARLRVAPLVEGRESSGR